FFQAISTRSERSRITITYLVPRPTICRVDLAHEHTHPVYPLRQAGPIRGRARRDRTDLLRLFEVPGAQGRRPRAGTHAALRGEEPGLADREVAHQVDGPADPRLDRSRARRDDLPARAGHADLPRAESGTQGLHREAAR